MIQKFKVYFQEAILQNFSEWLLLLRCAKNGLRVLKNWQLNFENVTSKDGFNLNYSNSKRRETQNNQSNKFVIFESKVIWCFEIDRE